MKGRIYTNDFKLNLYRTLTMASGGCHNDTHARQYGLLLYAAQ